MRLPLVKGSSINGQGEWVDSLPQNMVAFIQEVDGDNYYMRTLDGLKSFSDGFGEDRGGIWSDRFQIHVRVSGNSLLEIDQFGGVTDIGTPTVIAGSSQVQFANSFNSIAFIANGEYYRYDPVGGTLSIIAKPVGAGNYTDISFIDGYYTLTDTENVWATDIADETIVSPLSFAGSSFAPDNIVGCGKSTDNKLMVFNRYSTERFYNNAGPQFPFARIPNAAIPIGIVGPKAKVSVGDGAWVVLGGSKEYSPTFYVLTNTYQKISTGEIDSILGNYSDYELFNINMEFRDVRDQRLVICHLTRDTIVYDATASSALGTPIWYTWRSADGPWRGVNGVYDPRNVDNSASAWIYGDKDDSRIGKLDTNICTQYGEPIEWRVKTPIVVVGGTVAYMEILHAPGHNVIENPNTVGISTTKDGVLYGPEVPLDAGKEGEYQKRLIALKLGDYPLWFGASIRGYSRTVTTLAAVNIENQVP